MPKWNDFRAGVSKGLPNAELLAQLAGVESWLDLPKADALQAMESELISSPPLLAYRAMIAVNLTLQREASMPQGPEAAAATQELFNKVQQGEATEQELTLANRFAVLWELFGRLLALHPELNQPVSTVALAKMDLQSAATGIFKRLDPVAGQMSAGMANAAALETYEAVIRDAKALAANTSADNEGLLFVYSMTGGAERAAANGCTQLGRFEEARKLFEAAEQDFTRAGEAAEATDCADRARTLQQQISGGLDAAAQAALGTLMRGSGAKEVAAGASWERIGALMKMADVAGTASDVYEAAQYAEEAAKALADLGYRDPRDGFDDQTAQDWIATACAGFTGMGLLGRLMQTAMYFDGVLGARLAERVKRDPAEADRLQQVQSTIHAFERELDRQAREVAEECTRQLGRYFPPPAGAQTTEVNRDDFEVKLERMRALDGALLESQKKCNERAGAGQPMEDLLEAMGKLEAEADALGNSLHRAKTRLGRAYILYHLGRGAELRPVAQEARRLLLDGRPATLSSFTQSFERFHYLESLRRDVEGALMTADPKGALEICEATIRDFETQRYRATSDYRQSALLSGVAEFYTWAAFAAFKLERWDNMLEAIDLIKAHAVIRNRLIPETSQDADSEAAQEFGRVDAALSKDPGNEELKRKRRELWDLWSIARGTEQAAANGPRMSVPALQQALAADEAMIGYFWLATTVLLVVLVDRDRFHAERISLQADQLSRLERFVAFIQGLKSSHNMDGEVARLGAILLPEFVRGFIGTKKRIVISPHHSLHLFPFHAARWSTGGFLGTEFAVSYASNFSSVMLEWDQPNRDRVLAIGIGRFDGDYASPLDNVEEDAKAIARCYEASGIDAELLLGKGANRSRLQALREAGELSRLRCLHLGTHGLSVFESPNQPLESRILLHDGPVDAMELAMLGIKAELVVLSACHSGQRAIELRDLGEIPGDDIFGLQAALFKSGVGSILGTLWLVESDSASPLSRKFHAYLAAGEPADAALQRAVKDYLANPVDGLDSAYYWAPYFISFVGRRRKEARADG
jgi:CHAT domain-containing protein